MYSHLKEFQLLEIKTKRKLSGKLLGNYKSNFHGRGLEFQEFRHREEGEDSTAIDWLISSREGKILTRKMQEERNLSILQIIDTSLFSGDAFLDDKKLLLEQAYFLTSFSAIENGDRVATLFLDTQKNQYFPYSKKKSQLFQIYTIIHNMMPKKTKNSLQMKGVGVKNNLIFYYTNSFEIDIDTIKILAIKNQVVVVHIFHHFENTLEAQSNFSHVLFSGWVGGSLSIDIKNAEKKDQYKKLREEKIQRFEKKLRTVGVDYISLDTQSDTTRKFMNWSNQNI